MSNNSWQKNGRVPSSLLSKAISGTYKRAILYPEDEIIFMFKNTFNVSKNDNITVLGSCFSQQLNNALKYEGYKCANQMWGVIYNPQSLSQIANYTFKSDTWKPEEPFWSFNGTVYFPYLKANDHSGPMFLGNTEKDALKAQRYHFNRSKDLLSTTDVFILNLGLTELWRNKKDKLSFFSLPEERFYDENTQEFYSLTYDDVIFHLNNFITTILSANSKAKFILNVEPVPLSISFREHLGPYIATQYSKAILSAVAMSFAEKYDMVCYLPLYELLTNNKIKYYKNDGRHINDVGSKLFIKTFKELYGKQ